MHVPCVAASERALQPSSPPRQPRSSNTHSFRAIIYCVAHIRAASTTRGHLTIFPIDVSLERSSTLQSEWMISGWGQLMLSECAVCVVCAILKWLMKRLLFIFYDIRHNGFVEHKMDNSNAHAGSPATGNQICILFVVFHLKCWRRRQHREINREQALALSASKRCAYMRAES